MSRSDLVLQHSIALSFNSPIFFYPCFTFILPGESISNNFEIRNKNNFCAYILWFLFQLELVKTKQKKNGISSHWLKLSFSTVFKVSRGTCN